MRLRCQCKDPECKRMMKVDKNSSSFIQTNIESCGFFKNNLKTKNIYASNNVSNNKRI